MRERLLQPSGNMAARRAMKNMAADRLATLLQRRINGSAVDMGQQQGQREEFKTAATDGQSRC